jgi:hypothetical protein
MQTLQRHRTGCVEKRGLLAIRAVVCASLLLAAFLIAGRGANAQDPQPAPERRFYQAKDRLKAIAAASLFTPRAVSEADIMAGPPQKKDQFQLHLNDKVTCEFTKPGEEKNGNTPKFDCSITRVENAAGQIQTLTPDMDEEPVKVKFGRDNRETFAEAASTRLLWALGFYADAMFPVRVTCLNCPADPHKASGPRGTHVFNEGVIERKADGRKMYEISKGEDQGWSWKEFETVGRPSYEKDGLKMIAAFIIHSDNKPEQQRLVCDGAQVDQSTKPFTTTCKASRVLIQDTGATFGGGGAFTNGKSAKMNLSEWSKKRVWKKVGTSSTPQECQAELPKSWAAKDGLGDPVISEEGRRFAAGLMCQLSDRQISDLFTVARVAEQSDFRNSDGSFKNGLNEAAVVRLWADAFKRKREELAAGRCRMKTPPADLTVIDNPAGLPTVPNFCTARPF